LTGCFQTTRPPEVRTVVVTQAVPKTLRKCSDAPQWKTFEARANTAKRHATQAEVAEFITLVTGSGMDCRTKMKAVDELLTKVENRAQKK
jgi:hypothetical protein